MRVAMLLLLGVAAGAAWPGRASALDFECPEHDCVLELPAEEHWVYLKRSGEQPSTGIVLAVGSVDTAVVVELALLNNAEVQLSATEKGMLANLEERVAKTGATWLGGRRSVHQGLSAFDFATQERYTAEGGESFEAIKSTRWIPTAKRVFQLTVVQRAEVLEKREPGRYFERLVLRGELRPGAGPPAELTSRGSVVVVGLVLLVGLAVGTTALAVERVRKRRRKG